MHGNLSKRKGIDSSLSNADIERIQNKLFERYDGIVPVKVSDLENDTGFLTEQDIDKKSLNLIIQSDEDLLALRDFQSGVGVITVAEDNWDIFVSNAKENNGDFGEYYAVATMGGTNKVYKTILVFCGGHRYVKSVLPGGTQYLYERVQYFLVDNTLYKRVIEINKNSETGVFEFDSYVSFDKNELIGAGGGSVDIVDSFDSTAADKALSANMGNVLHNNYIKIGNDLSAHESDTNLHISQLEKNSIHANMKYAVSYGDSEVNIVLYNNYLTICNGYEGVESLVISMPTVIEDVYYSEFSFNSGETATNLNYASTPIVWCGEDCDEDGAFIPEPNTTYEVSIKNLIGFGIVARVGVI